ncbi:MAG TPA: zf-HC2 domain-containing protein [Blastocatellia bacterium]|nr:zf-HC2 domain-containing protein [Blastocatellia bacterium]
MDCRKVEDKIWLYAEGDLEAAQIRKVRSHLDACQSCRKLLDAVLESQGWLKSFKSPDFDETVYRAIRRETMTRIKKDRSFGGFLQRWVKDNWKQGAACTAAVFALFLTLHVRLFSGNHGGSSAAPSNKEQTGQKLGQVTPAPFSESSASAQKRVARPHFRSAKPTRRGLDVGRVAEGGAALASNAGAIERPLRIEIQTSDPNVRIIWFVPGGSKPAPPVEDKDTM